MIYNKDCSTYLIVSMGPIFGDGTGLEIGRVGGKFLLGGGLLLKKSII